MLYLYKRRDQKLDILSDTYVDFVFLLNESCICGINVCTAACLHSLCFRIKYHTLAYRDTNTDIIVIAWASFSQSKTLRTYLPTATIKFKVLLSVMSTFQCFIVRLLQTISQEESYTKKDVQCLKVDQYVCLFLLRNWPWSQIIISISTLLEWNLLSFVQCKDACQ